MSTQPHLICTFLSPIRGVVSVLTPATQIWVKCPTNEFKWTKTLNFLPIEKGIARAKMIMETFQTWPLTMTSSLATPTSLLMMYGCTSLWRWEQQNEFPQFRIFAKHWRACHGENGWCAKHKNYPFLLSRHKSWAGLRTLTRQLSRVSAECSS